MAAFRNIKAKLHFALSGGEGQPLSSNSNSNNSNNNRSSSTSIQTRQPTTSSNHKRISAGQPSQSAGSAALSRFDTQHKPSQEVRREIERDRLLLANTSPSATEMKVAQKLASTSADSHSKGGWDLRVLIECPLTGNTVLFEDRLRHLQASLQDMYLSEPLYSSCLMIHTLGTNSPYSSHLNGTSHSATETEKIQSCIEVLSKCLKNVIDNPNEEKYRKIKYNGKSMKEKVLPIVGSELFLQTVGFKQALLPSQTGEDEQYFLMELGQQEKELIDAEMITSELSVASPNEAIVSPNEPNEAIASPNEANEAIASPNEPNEAIASPNEPNEAIASPNEPNEPNEAIASPNEPNEAIASPNEAIGELTLHAEDTSNSKNEDLITITQSDGASGSNLDTDVTEKPDTSTAESLDLLATALELLQQTKPVKFELNRDLQVFKASHIANHFAPLPASFYVLKPDEMKREYEAKKESVEISEMLMTRQHRDKISRPISTRQYQFCVIRVRLPDGHVIQGTFRARDKLSNLFSLVSESIKDETTLFSLFRHAGKKLENFEETFEKAELVPSALVNMSSDFHTTVLLKDYLAQNAKLL